MYTIRKTDHKIVSMTDAAWEIAETASVNINNWKQFEYLPNTYAKVLYNQESLYVKMWTDETPLLARFTKQNERVCNDSCMDFFSRPTWRISGI